MKTIFACVNFTKFSNHTNRCSYRYELPGTTLCIHELSPEHNNDLKNIYEDNNYLLLINGDLFDENIDLRFIVQSISTQGILKTLQSLDGIFSMLLFDKKNSKLYLSRDHIGIYPFYYYQDNDILLFSNDLKSFRKSEFFKKKIDKRALAQFFQRGYIAQPLTIFENCYKLMPSSYIEFDLSSRKLSLHKYWDINQAYNQKKIDDDEEHIVNKCETLLRESIKKRIQCCDDVCSFLSGGFDSSTILALGKTIKNKKFITFTMGFNDQKLSEAKIAQEISSYLQSEHHEHILSKEDILNSLKETISIYPEPFGDKAAFASNILIEDAKNYSTMMLGGDGGDEIFFSSSFIDKLKMIDKIPYFIRKPISLILKTKKDIFCRRWSKILAEKDIYNSINHKILLMNKYELSYLIKGYLAKTPYIVKPPTVSNFYDGIFLNIINDYLYNNLIPKTSALSLHHKIKIRLPFLDKNLIEYVATIDPKLKMKNKINKYITRKIAYKYIPKEILDQPKKGFNVPLEEYIKQENETIFKRYLSKEKIENEGILDYKMVRKIKNEFLEKDNWISQQRLWNLLVFEIWYEDWFDK